MPRVHLQTMLEGIYTRVVGRAPWWVGSLPSPPLGFKAGFGLFSPPFCRFLASFRLPFAPVLLLFACFSPVLLPFRLFFACFAPFRLLFTPREALPHTRPTVKRVPERLSS